MKVEVDVPGSLIDLRILWDVKQPLQPKKKKN